MKCYHEMRAYSLLTLLFVLAGEFNDDLKVKLWIVIFHGWQKYWIPGDCRSINLSLNKRAYLSSVHEEHHARYAVDGIVSEKQYAQALNINAEGWFVVDLGRPYQVKLVLLYFRPNCSDCGERANYWYNFVKWAKNWLLFLSQVITWTI